LAGQAALVGPRPASDSNALATGRSYRLPTYVMINASLSLVDLRLFPSGPLEMSVYCHNLSDVRAADPGFVNVDYPLARRSFTVELRQKF
jgi:hypothetical protein